MTVEEFFRWQEGQEDRYELVDGFPIKMMTGASNVHDAILVNIVVSLGNQLRGKSCRVSTPDTAVRTRSKSARRPDVTISCGPILRDSYEARQPKVVIEVLSKSNRGILWQRKLAEYQALEGIAHILLIDSLSIRATMQPRAPDGGWSPVDFDGLDGRIELSAVGCTLAMRDVYDGIPPDQLDMQETGDHEE